MVQPALPFEELEHTADVRLLVRGATLERLFTHAAQGMFALMCCYPAGVTQPCQHRVSLASYDLEALLVDWLNELLYLSDTEATAYDEYGIDHLEPTRLDALVRGQKPCAPHRVIKAATFADLRVRTTEAGYEVVLTFDV